MRARRTLGMVALLGGWLAAWGGADGAEQPIREWTIHLRDFYSWEGQSIPATIYAKERDGVWVSAAGSSLVPGKAHNGQRAFNKSWQCPDLSRAPIVNGRMEGPVTLVLTPDLWVPVSHRAMTVVLDVDTKVAGDGKLEGRYTVRPIESDDRETLDRIRTTGGAIEGASKPGTVEPIPDPVTLSLMMQGSPIGGKPSYVGRCMALELGVEGGKVTHAVRGFLSQNFSTYGHQNVPLENCEVSVEDNRFKGWRRCPSWHRLRRRRTPSDGRLRCGRPRA